MDNLYNPPVVVTNTQILSIYSESYMRILLFAGTVLFMYVLYNNFFKKPSLLEIKAFRLSKFLEERGFKSKDLFPIKIDIDELALLPAAAIFILALSYYLRYNGV